jgi:hypothetical protein
MAARDETCESGTSFPLFVVPGTLYPSYGQRVDSFDGICMVFVFFLNIEVVHGSCCRECRCPDCLGRARSGGQSRTLPLQDT